MECGTSRVTLEKCSLLGESLEKCSSLGATLEKCTADYRVWEGGVRERLVVWREALKHEECSFSWFHYVH